MWTQAKICEVVAVVWLNLSNLLVSRYFKGIFLLVMTNISLQVTSLGSLFNYRPSQDDVAVPSSWSFGTCHTQTFVLRDITGSGELCRPSRALSLSLTRLLPLQSRRLSLVNTVAAAAGGDETVLALGVADTKDKSQRGGRLLFLTLL